MKTSLSMSVVFVLLAGIAAADNDQHGAGRYAWLKQLAGDWVLSAAQEGDAVKHPVIAPLVGSDKIAVSYRLVGAETTLQENIFPGTPREMATMYHCADKACDQVRATHYCVLKNQPALLAQPQVLNDKLVLNCDMQADICNSNDVHLHVITLELSDNNRHLKETFSLYRDGKHVEDLIFHFDRKQ
jgi:hypothetical protein